MSILWPHKLTGESRRLWELSLAIAWAGWCTEVARLWTATNPHASVTFENQEQCIGVWFHLGGWRRLETFHWDIGAGMYVAFRDDIPALPNTAVLVERVREKAGEYLLEGWRPS